MLLRYLALSLTIAAPLCPTIRADDTAKYRVSIESVNFGNGAAVDTVDILVDTQGDEIAAVDLKVATNSRFIEISQIIRGAICDSCAWEFFNVRKQKDIDSLELTSIWQIVTLADMMPDSLEPICYGWKQSGSIARLVVNRLRDPIPLEHIDSVLFLWGDCSDNSISGRSGVELAISTLPDTVGFSGVVPMSLNFPNTIAAPGSCIKPDKKDRVRRLIKFEPGIVRYISDTTSQ